MQGEHAVSRKMGARRRWLTVACVVVTGLLCAGGARAQSALRSLSGTVKDSGREPIRNAVVELRNGSTNQIVTYITDATGRYIFKRLDGSTDYEVWVMFRGHRSATRNISKFDSHMVDVINFTVRTY